MPLYLSAVNLINLLLEITCSCGKLNGEVATPDTPTSSRGCHEDATRKRVTWNSSFTVEGLGMVLTTKPAGRLIELRFNIPLDTK